MRTILTLTGLLMGGLLLTGCGGSGGGSDDGGGGGDPIGAMVIDSRMGGTLTLIGRVTYPAAIVEGVHGTITLWRKDGGRNVIVQTTAVPDLVGIFGAGSSFDYEYENIESGLLYSVQFHVDKDADLAISAGDYHGFYDGTTGSPIIDDFFAWFELINTSATFNFGVGEVPTPVTITKSNG